MRTYASPSNGKTKKGNHLSLFDFRNFNHSINSTRYGTPADTRAPRDVDQAAWQYALVGGTRVVLNYRSGLSLASFSLDASDPVKSVDYRPSWLLDEARCEYLPFIREETITLIDRAVDLVTSGYRPPAKTGAKVADDDKNIWPMSVVQSGSSRDWPNTWPSARQNAPRKVLRSAWPAIQRLATEASFRTRLSITDVRNIVYPETVLMLTADAYRLAARSVAGSHAGIRPVYLSVFNFQGRGPEFREVAERVEPLTLRERALLAFAGPLASMKTTGMMAIDPRDEHIRAVNELDTGQVFGPGVGPDGFISQFTPQVERFNNESWDAIEKLATQLERRYCVLGDEISTVLSGTDACQVGSQ